MSNKMNSFRYGRQSSSVKNLRSARRRSLALALVGLLGVPAHEGRAGLWSTAYYAAWMQDYMPASQVDFTTLTHVIHFAVVPNVDGTLDSDYSTVTLANSTVVVGRAHATGTKALISVGGTETAGGFRGATSAPHLAAFITNIIAFATSRGYDGVDLDWEPLEASDAASYSNLVHGLRTALNAINPRPLLTAATATEPALFAALQAQFDQINLMTYDLSGPWPGWVTWFNAPIYDGGYRFRSTGELVPSTDGMVNDFIDQGVSASKLGIGIAFYGYVWSGGNGTATGGSALPRQSWSSNNPPVCLYTPYHTVMANYYQPQLYVWDSDAQAAYLSIDNSGSANDKFISYDDPHACTAKVAYAAAKGLGGVMIYELTDGYCADQPAGSQDPLLQAVKQALRKTFRITGIKAVGNDIILSFSSAIGQTYSAEWISNLTATEWHPITNLIAIGLSTPAVDAGAAGQPGRFYRVREVRSGSP